MQIVLTGSGEDQSRLERLNFLLKRIFLKPKEESQPRFQYYTFGFQFLFDGEVMEGFEKNEYIAPEVVADWFNYVMKSTTFPGVTEVRAVYHGDLRNPVKIDLIPEIWFKSQGGKK